MCHSQLSGCTLPSAALMPPCAATVCERVGKTLETTATCASPCASCSAARSPPPPAPMTRQSKRRRAMVFIKVILKDELEILISPSPSPPPAPAPPGADDQAVEPPARDGFY